MNIMKPLTAAGTALFSASSLGHNGLDVAPGTLFSGWVHPFTGLDHVLTLLLLGGVIALLYTAENRQLKRVLAGLVTLGILLSWSFLHYSGDYFAIYAVGFASSSGLLMSAGASIACISKRFKGAFRRS